jgi:hypothetical protein
VKAKIEIYPMKQSPNRWAWRLMVNGNAVCKSIRSFTSVRLAENNYARANNGFHQLFLKVDYKK